MQAFLQTSLVGGKDGTRFDDVFTFVIPMVDGIQITYQLANGGTTTLNHGGQSSSAQIIKLSDDESLVGVFGRAGPQTYYKRDMINNIGFVFFNDKTDTVRTVGPFGNSNNSNEGTSFYSSNVFAFGGFAVSENALGLSGLFFYRS
ncbi:hypothetical protein EW026_g4019 [Hermanssonia centrifuga]|uniref:Jacalin-type lectin domain-containing protein n=1 Tax=Hermanssonia centrifuga TaxID=98765 RepID=A0A4S4KKA3_9APHY|nr:hypothetical protein EW026_g4019 [Hermanssonia centrifuga]